ncbi:MAG: formate dehydrogenase accessory sulfurtransferase FdhD [Cohaesibacter sp.]|jgi:FdhD protein|nr:formate dehydrogenase accessory sulfurtransferase FdhD [Cohaesibacter sp.]
MLIGAPNQSSHQYGRLIAPSNGDCALSEPQSNPAALPLLPQPEAEGLSRTVSGLDHEGREISLQVVTEKPLTLYLNSQEIVTMMTIGDQPDLLAIGYLQNQNMLLPQDVITGIDYDDDLGVIVVRTERQTNYEDKLKKKIKTSGCAQGTIFGDVMDAFDDITLSADARLKTSWLYQLAKDINTTPSLYLEAGAIHGCVLCQEDRILAYMEDVGRHNAVDKIAGWMRVNDIDPSDKIFYTTGRLTSEMVIKTVMMGLPILVSRSGFTAWGVELARKAGLTLIGRARGKRFVALSGAERIDYDGDAALIGDEDPKMRRKGAETDR